MDRSEVHASGLIILSFLVFGTRSPLIWVSPWQFLTFTHIRFWSEEGLPKEALLGFVLVNPPSPAGRGVLGISHRVGHLDIIGWYKREEETCRDMLALQLYRNG